MSVDIVLCTYNSAKYIESTLDCILGQSYKQWKLIVVDDGSSDNTVSVIENKLKDEPRVKKIIANSKNLGISKSFNLGISNCTEDYVCTLGADDFWAANKLETQLGFLKRNPEFSFCFTGVQLKFSNTRSKIISIKSSPIELEYFLSEFDIQFGSSFMMKTEELQMFPFNEELATNEDWEFICRVISSGHLGYCIPEALTRCNIKQATSSKSSKNKNDSKIALRSIFSKLDMDYNSLKIAKLLYFAIKREMNWNLNSKMPIRDKLITSFELVVFFLRLFFQKKAKNQFKVAKTITPSV